MIEEQVQGNWQDAGDDVQFFEPLKAQDKVQAEIDFVEKSTWKVKEGVTGYEGMEFKAMKVTLKITDESVETEHADAKPRLTVEDVFNIEKYPYLDKKDFKVKFLNRNKLFQIEEALGFEPLFTDKTGQEVAPHITKNGNKVAPKVEGVKRVLNRDFASAYFNQDGSPIVDNWVGKKLLIDLEVEKSEQFGDKNRVKRYRKAE